MEMIQILKCDMSDCEYNIDNLCHTIGVNISERAECQTYIQGKNKRGFQEVKGGIGACHTANCEFNVEHECRARDGIKLAVNRKKARCETYHPQHVPNVKDIAY